jgi:phosphoribosylformylglycinamidine cyclo-ligase
MTAGARGRFGGFGGMFRMPSGTRAPLLVSSADGVGTKVKVAVEAGRLDTVGHDLVNHCVNDILVQGARPLFFLDYVAFGKLEPASVEAVVAGVAAGCRENGCALVGGETAEMPGVYTPPDFDLAGFIVGWVEEDEVLGSERVREDDVLIGFASSGLHTNGYSLARRIVSDRLRLGPHDRFPESDGERRRRAARGAPQLPRRARAGARPGARDGPHHRRRAPREPQPGAPRAAGRGRGHLHVGGAVALPRAR